MKKIFFILCLIFTFILPNCAYSEGLNIYSKSAIVIDAASGRILYEKNAYEPLPMASTTKIMTAVLALEYGNLDDDVTVSEKAASAPKVRLNLSVGEKQKLGDLLYPLMLESANDAAVAIAEHIGGSVDSFCEMMTEKAKEIGAYDTVFRTPNGLDFEDHHSTAYDMALITRYALNNEKFVDIINTRQITIGGGEYKTYTLTNKNRLLSEYDGAIGVKTGYTNSAGNCFVGAAKRGDTLLISVVLASGWGSTGKERKWTDTKQLLNYGFNTYKTQKLVDEGIKIETLPVEDSWVDFVDAVTQKSFEYPLKSGEMGEVVFKKALPSVLYAPVKAGDIIGELRIYNKSGEFFGQVPLIAAEDKEKRSIKSAGKLILLNGLNYLMCDF